jgi:hypothetical protein
MVPLDCSQVSFGCGSVEGYRVWLLLLLVIFDRTRFVLDPMDLVSYWYGMEVYGSSLGCDETSWVS